MTTLDERPPALVLPSAEDPVVAAAVGAVGGPLGRHARRERRFWTPVRIILALTLLTCTFGFLQKAPCRSGNWVHDYQYTRACYNDPFPLYGARGFDKPGLPYIDNPLEYPVMIGGLMHLASELVQPFPEGERARRFFDVTAGLMTVFALITGICLALIHRRRPWDAALFAVSPGLLFAAFNNWDLAAAGFVALGMLAWARRHPVLAGLAFGLGTATKLYPVVLLIPLGVLCLRAGKLRPFFITIVSAVLAWLAVNLPIALAAPEGWKYFYSFSQERGADWGSIWYFLQHLRGPLDEGLAAGAAPARLNAFGTGLFLLLLLGVVALAWKAPRRPRVPQVMFLALVAFMISNKVYSPQFVIWVVPLAVLARPRWRTFLVWQFTEVVAFFAIWYYLIHIGNAGRGISDQPYFTALLTRDAVLLFLAGLVVREIVRPDRDVVRQDGTDDPAGGVLDGAPDRPSLVARRSRRGAPEPAEGAPLPEPV
ncbi:MAG TPA: glycosyltransferase 87 family protein [Mycobacteriales bacterium]|nr:glycosyltransferase 87 family protein [Mycobacteriales bacterium]